MSQEGQKDHAQSNNKLDDGAQDDKGSKNSSPKVDPKLALLQDTWLESELEVIELKTRKRKGESVGEALAAAKKRRDVLWKQLLGEWKKGWKRSAKLKSKVVREPAVSVEQSAEQDEAEKHIEPGELGEQDSEEPPRKKSRLQASQHEARSSSSGTNGKFAPFTNQQKDHMRALICKTLGDISPPSEEVEPVAKAAGLSVLRVRLWLREFYRYNPNPTLGQATAWRTSSWRDVLEEWLAAHRDHPYPSREEKERLVGEAGRTLEQVNTWFANARCSSGQTLTAQKEQPTDQEHPLFAWLHGNMIHPYPSAEKKKELAEETGLTLTKVDTWFILSRMLIDINQGNEEYEGRCLCCGEADV